MNSTLNKIIFLCLITHGLAANTPKLSDIYQDAITFSPDLATAKATLTESRGLQFENIYNFVPAPLIAYDLKTMITPIKMAQAQTPNPNYFQ